MAFTSINSGIIAVGKALTNYLMTLIKDNFDALNGSIETLAVGLKNGSFEVDSDADGNPDNWARTTYPGGAVARTTTEAEVAHGQAGLKIIHPGGANNGGGTLTSDYIAVSEFERLIISLLMWVSVVGMKNRVIFYWYDNAKVACPDASTTVYDSTAGNTAPVPLVLLASPPADCRFMKVQLAGGYTDTDVAGNIFFDGVKALNSWPFMADPVTLPDNYSVANYYGNPSAYTDLETPFDIDCPYGESCKINLYAGSQRWTGTSGVTRTRFKITGPAGTYYTNAIASLAVNQGAMQYAWLNATLSSGNAGQLTVQMQGYHDAGAAYGNYIAPAQQPYFDNFSQN